MPLPQNPFLFTMRTMIAALLAAAIALVSFAKASAPQVAVRSGPDSRLSLPSLPVPTACRHGLRVGHSPH